MEAVGRSAVLMSAAHAITKGDFAPVAEVRRSRGSFEGTSIASQHVIQDQPNIRNLGLNE
jgi:hypothetical protein